MPDEIPDMDIEEVELEAPVAGVTEDAGAEGTTALGEAGEVLLTSDPRIIPYTAQMLLNLLSQDIRRRTTITRTNKIRIQTNLSSTTLLLRPIT